MLHVSFAISPSLPFFLLPTALPSLAYLLLFDAFIDLGCGFLVGPEQTDYTCPLRVQNIPILIPNHLVQLQDPVVGSRRGEDWGDWKNANKRQRTKKG